MISNNYNNGFRKQLNNNNGDVDMIQTLPWWSAKKQSHSYVDIKTDCANIPNHQFDLFKSNMDCHLKKLNNAEENNIMKQIQTTQQVITETKNKDQLINKFGQPSYFADNTFIWNSERLQATEYNFLHEIFLNVTTKHTMGIKLKVNLQSKVICNDTSMIKYNTNSKILSIYGESLEHVCSIGAYVCFIVKSPFKSAFSQELCNKYISKSVDHRRNLTLLKSISLYCIKKKMIDNYNI